MNQSVQSTYRAISAAFLVISAIAVWIGWRELSPFIMLGGSHANRLEMLGSTVIGSGLSGYSKDIVLVECLAALQSAQGRLMPAVQKEAVAANCRTISTNILARNPLHGFAAYIAAHNSAILGDRDSANTFFRISKMAAPNELWLARHRLQLYREWPDTFTEQSFAGVRSDISLLGMTNEGRVWLADWFLSGDKTHDLVSRVVESLSEDVQAGFLSSLKRAAVESSPQ